MDVSIEPSKTNPVRRLLVWFAGFLLTGKVANEHTLTTLRRVSAARAALALGNLALVGAALYYLLAVMPTGYTLFFLAVPLYWVGLRALFVGGITVVSGVLERVQYYRREHYSSEST